MIANRNDVDNSNNSNDSNISNDSNRSERRSISNRNPSNDSVNVMDDGESSVFSEKNPLPSDFDERNRLPPHHQQSKVPRAVAMTGWSRTVGADETGAPPPNVQLGAPGTGLSSAALATEKALGRTLGRKARELQASSVYTARGINTWGKACVTAEDVAAAAALRKIRPPDGAVPLPSQRPWSETDASTIAGSPESTARRRRERGCQSCSSSSTSSDLNFLVAPGTGSFFGTRPTIGRAVEKLRPAAVGEATLHDSLAKYFEHRVEEQSGEGRGSSASALTARTAAISTSSQKSDEQADPCTALVNFTTKSATRESSFDDGTRGERIAAASSRRAGERGTRPCTADGSVVFFEVGPLEMTFYPSMRAADSAAAAAIGDATALEKKGDSRKGALPDERTQRRQRKGKQETASRRNRRSSSDYVDGRQGGTLCGCARTWPWKVFLGASIFFAFVMVATSGGVSLANEKRQLRGGDLMMPKHESNQGWKDAAIPLLHPHHSSWPRRRRLQHVRHFSGVAVDRRTVAIRGGGTLEGISERVGC